MNRYSNDSNYSSFDCQCPYRDTCERYGYRDNDNRRDGQGCADNRRRAYRGRECNSCSICNIFRRCGH